MFGGTPSNLAISVMTQRKVEVIAGVNLPMLIKLAGVRAKMGLNEAVREAKDAARKYIRIASEELVPGAAAGAAPGVAH
jgi:PTS system mannose-specific IIA component